MEPESIEKAQKMVASIWNEATEKERQRWIARARLLRWPHDEGHTSEWWGGWNSVIGALLEDMGVSDE